jgi:hypothetical protein
MERGPQSGPFFIARRFTYLLTKTGARLGADVDCSSFIVVDFHHLLLAGSPVGCMPAFLGSLLREVAGKKSARTFGTDACAESV